MAWFKTDIPFARDDASRFLPAIVAVMVATIALLLAVGISFAQSISVQSSDAKGAIAIQLPVAKNDRIRAINDTVLVLKSTAGVSDIAVLSDEDIKQLLAPWLGKSDSLNELSLPVLIDVKTTPINGHPVDIEALTKAIKTKVGTARVQPSQHWLTQLDTALSVAQTILLMLALSMTAGLIGLSILIARTSLKLHFKTVNILHLFGATDDYILRQFQYHSGLIIGRGAMVGSLVAAILVYGIHRLSDSAGAGLLPAIEFSIMHAVLFIFLPIMIALVALVATRFTVQSMLHRLH